MNDDNARETGGNFRDHLVIPLERLEIAQYHPLPNGQGKPTAVLLIAQPPESFPERLRDLMFVARFRSREGLERFIESLRAHANEVWPID